MRSILLAWFLPCLYASTMLFTNVTLVDFQKDLVGITQEDFVNDLLPILANFDNTILLTSTKQGPVEVFLGLVVNYLFYTDTELRVTSPQLFIDFPIPLYGEPDLLITNTQGPDFALTAELKGLTDLLITKTYQDQLCTYMLGLSGTQNKRSWGWLTSAEDSYFYKCTLDVRANQCTCSRSDNYPIIPANQGWKAVDYSELLFNLMPAIKGAYLKSQMTEEGL